MDGKSDGFFNMARMCRLCLSQAGVMSPIFDQGEPNAPPLSSKITTIISIQLYLNDGLPSIICHRCLYQVEKSYDFKTQCETSDAMLRKYMSALHSTFPQKVQLVAESTDKVSPVDGYCSMPQQHSGAHSSTYSDSPLKRKRGRPRKEENLIFYSSPVHTQSETSNIPNYQDNEIKIVDGIESVVTVVDPRSEMLSNSDEDVKLEQDHGGQGGPDTHEEHINMKNLNTHDEETMKSLAIARAKAKVYMSVVVGVDDNGVKSRRHLCIGCGKTFGHSSDLRKHVLVHTGERPFHCQICTKTFSRRTNLNKHMKVHTGQKPFCCTNCPKSFATKGDLQRHLIIHSGIKPFSCHLCNQCFSRKDKLTRHVKLHETHAVRKLNFKCSFCPNIYHAKVDLKQHMELDHAKELKYMEEFEVEVEGDGEGEEGKGYLEEPCLKDDDSSNDRELCKVEERSTGEREEEGDGEGEESHEEEPEQDRDQAEVESMVINIDPFQVDSELSDTYPYWDDKPKTELDSPKDHEACEGGEACDGGEMDELGEAGEAPCSARQGGRAKGKSPQCKVCERRFSEVAYLRAHLVTHSSLKPHQCSMCDKAFTRRRELLRHENVHTGVKPFACLTCSKAFSRKDKLARHEKIHNGVRSLHSCMLCKASFLKVEELMVHQATHAAANAETEVQNCQDSSSQEKPNGVEDEENSEEEEEEESDEEKGSGRGGSPLDQLSGNPAITVTSLSRSLRLH